MTTRDRQARRSAAAAVEFHAVPADAPQAQDVVANYFAEIDRRFATGFATAEQSSHDVASMSPPGGVFVVGFSNGDPVACGGVQTIPSDPPGADAPSRADRGWCAEIKRMWVQDDWRGSGLGSRLLRHLEERAAALGHRIVRLDTNDTLTEAIGLYRRAGYREIPRYNDNPYARLWFSKTLSYHEADRPGAD